MEEKKSNKFIESLALPAKFVMLIWGIHLFQWASGIDLRFLGTLPKQIEGLRGIIFTPLLHKDFGHIISNTPPLFVLSAIIMFFYRRVAIPSFLMIYLLTGLAVWLFARTGYNHIGASGVIYGLVAFVFWSGIFRRNIKSIVLALIVVFYYGSMVLGIIPGDELVSWESHLMGGLVGIFVAYWFKEKIEKDEEREKYSWETEPETEKKPFLDQTVFDKTKEQRRQEEQQSKDDLGGWFSNRTW